MIRDGVDDRGKTNPWWHKSCSSLISNLLQLKYHIVSQLNSEYIQAENTCRKLFKTMDQTF